LNWLVFTSGIFALLTTIGHFAVGTKQFLVPMLAAIFDPVAKKVMHCVFHYISAFLILSTLALLLVGTGMLHVPGGALLVQFIACNYLVFAIWQIVLASASGIPKGVFKLFQWVFFVLISVFALVGTRGC
jgi:hypothetical protein